MCRYANVQINLEYARGIAKNIGNFEFDGIEDIY